MKWTPSPPELVQIFGEVGPGPPTVRKKMFGYPAAFINGNMFAGLFQDNVIVRLAERERGELIREGGRPFEPMPGRPMREYVVLPTAAVKDRTRLSSWVKKALAYASRLPPKTPKKAAGRSESATKPKAKPARSRKSRAN